MIRLAPAGSPIVGGVSLVGVRPLFGPVPGGVESFLAVALGVVALVLQAFIAYRWIRGLRRAPAEFRTGFRNASGEDVRTFWKYVLPALAVELLAIFVLWPDAVTPVTQAAVLAVVLLFVTLALVATLAVCYLVVRRFAEGYREGQQ